MATETTNPKQAGRWRPGQSGNPSGRPAGSRHAAHVALDGIGLAGAADALRAVVAAAKNGDMRAAEILLRRAWPERRGRPITLRLPPLETAADGVTAMATVIAAMGDGTLSATEASGIAGVLELHRRAIETADLERRLRALEATHAHD